MRRSLVDAAWRQADDTAIKAGVHVRSLTSIDEIATLDRVFAEVWGSPGHTIAPIELTRAMQHAGNYVVGAFSGDRMVGGSLGFFGEHDGRRHLHSHVTGVLPDLQARSVGYAIKVHQRAWALAAGLDEVVWTFDLLVRRNAYLNLTKLGAEVIGFEPDFYGDALSDDINAGVESDRGVVRWPVAAESVVAALAGRRDPEAVTATAGVVILGEDAVPRPRPPRAAGATTGGETLAAWVPPDIVDLRRREPESARAWRRAVRESIGPAIADGYVAVGMSRDGWYRLIRRAAR